MKPKVNDQRCGASESACKALKVCPVGAISYIEAGEMITDRNVECGICAEECCGAAIEMAD